jgi:hypothetical protein
VRSDNLSRSRISRDIKDGNSNGRKRVIDGLVEARQKCEALCHRCSAFDTHAFSYANRILKENSELERLRAASSREFQPIARAVDRLYNSLGCNDVMPVRYQAGSRSLLT